MKKYLFIIVLVACSITVFSQYKLYEEGLSNYKEQNYYASIKFFTEFLSKAVRDKKFDLDVYYYRALSFYKKGEYKNAIDDFEETILRDHSNKGNIYWFMAKSQDRLGLYTEAINDYTSALSVLGNDAEIKSKLLYERSQEYSKLGNHVLAYEDLKNGYAANPENADLKKELDKINKQKTTSGSTSLEKNQRQSQPRQKKDESAQKSDPVVSKPVAMVKKETAKPIVQPSVMPASEGPVTVTSTLADAYKDEKRFALVIGNAVYPKNIGVLRNPVNDATDFAKELQNSNFEVQLLTNATYGQMRAAMLKFKEKVDAGERDKTVSLFYYAGHGLQRDDENYLVPVDATMEFEDDIARYCFPVQRMVLANMERSNARMNIVILDACRNNPFPALTRSLAEQGLGEMKRARGSFIAYATAPGSVAADGSGRNGLYTQELIKAIRKQGQTIEQVFKEVRRNVLRMSGDKQNTWDSSNITGEFYFKFDK